MGSDGSNSPKPWTQKQARTLFLRVPNDLWLPVTRGRKTEFRASNRFFSKRYSFTPSPVVAYRVRTTTSGQYDSKLMVLEEVYEEPLGAISEESLRREGFADLAEFRKDWIRRNRRHFDPLRVVTVFRIRPWQDGDEEEMGRALLRRLYGEHLW